MELKDMKLTESEQKEQGLCCSPDSKAPAYGWGLQLYLSDDHLKKMGLGKLEAGQAVTIEAKGIVESSSERVEVKDGRNASCTIQITNLGVEAHGELTNAADILYPNMKK